MFDSLSDDDLRVAYNDAPKPNVYGQELMRRIFARDASELGMSADNARLR